MGVELCFLGNVGYEITMGWNNDRVWWETYYGSLKMCNEIKGMENLLVPKFDNLQKQTCGIKCKVPHLGCVMG